ncbi:hypothetical protein BKA63DRAFT_599777 [Paraphoma chrysanthemicola]|nr:hypothetical protein BKA63DRAFT_599777 [Paraphoma chrysanthemicola]
MLTPTYSHTTIWLWPTGLFPRRIIYYLRAKHINTTLLQKHNITLVPVTLSDNALVALDGHEARPADSSLPVMRVKDGDRTETWIRESSSIMEYLEEVFTHEGAVGEGVSSVDSRGTSLHQRARTRDILSLLSDAIIWSTVAMIHSNPATTFWSGLTRADMSPATAAHAQKKFDALLSKLERWVERDVVVRKTNSLSGEGADVTFADIALMAQVEYMHEMYGLDWVAEHGVLRVWWERAKGEEWVVKREALLEAERKGEWGCVLGA